MTIDPKKAQQTADAYTAAWNSGSAQAVAEFYAKDGGIVINRGEPRDLGRGRLLKSGSHGGGRKARRLVKSLYNGSLPMAASFGLRRSKKLPSNPGGWRTQKAHAVRSSVSRDGSSWHNCSVSVSRNVRPTPKADLA